MPKIIDPDHSIESNTKFIKMIASRDGPLSEQPEEEWYLTLSVSGIHMDFVPAEGLSGYMVSKKEVLQRITEFEQMMRAENQDYVQNLVMKFMNSLEQEPQG